MPDRYDRSIKVPQSVIDEIRKSGMAASVAKARSGQASKEFLEGAKRMYGGNRVMFDKVPEPMAPGIAGPPKPGQRRTAGPATPASSRETSSSPTATGTQQKVMPANIAGPPGPNQVRAAGPPKPKNSKPGSTATPGGADVNRPEYRKRLAAAKKLDASKDLRKEQTAVKSLTKQASTDTKVRHGRDPNYVDPKARPVVKVNKDDTVTVGNDKIKVLPAFRKSAQDAAARKLAAKQSAKASQGTPEYASAKKQASAELRKLPGKDIKGGALEKRIQEILKNKKT